MQQNNGVDKRQIILFMLFSLIMMGAMIYFSGKDAEKAAQATEPSQTATVQDQAAKPATFSNLNDSLKSSSIQNVELKNKELTLVVSAVGGQLSSVELNEYKAYNSDTDTNDKKLMLFDKNNATYGFEFKDKTGKTFHTKDLVFVPQQNGNSVAMQARVNGALIEFVYTLKDQYTVDFQVKTQGLSQLVSGNSATFTWDQNARQFEKGRSQEQTHTEFGYAFNNYKSYDYDGRTSMDEPDEVLNWISVKQQFFAAVLEAQDGFKNSEGYQDTIEEGEFLKTFNFTGKSELTAGEFNKNFTWYFMPLDLKLLKTYDKNFDELLPLGWSFIGAMNRGFFMPMYNIIAGWGLTAGWVIFLMTIIVKLILSPIMFKQHKLSAMMRVIRPEIDEVNEKFKGADPMKKQQEIMSVYRKAGVNQMAGCLPALVQIPIFYALFRLFPNFIDLRGVSFWFAKDLTAYDDVLKLPFKLPFLGWDHVSIFALACTVVILIYTVMTSGNIQQPQQEGMPNMKVLMYIFPITFFFFLNSASSGLSWYYFVSNAINIFIILAIKYLILDEKKIHAQIQENKTKAPKPEGKFQKRMREMMEQAQEQQRLQQQQQNKKKK